MPRSLDDSRRILNRASLACFAVLVPLLLTGAAPALQSQTRLLVTVVDPKTGEPVTNLSAGDFTVRDGRDPRAVRSAIYATAPADIMLLVDTSLVGPSVAPLPAAFIDSLEAKEQMAIVSFATSANLLQDFTASQDLLRRAVAGLKYGNNPRVVDALYAAAESGFQNAVNRKVIVVLSAGVEGFSRTKESDVLALVRRRGISIFPVFVVGADRKLFESLAAGSGGAYFSARKLKLSPQKLAACVCAVLRGHYVLTLSGDQPITGTLKIEAALGRRKLWASSLPLD